MYEYLEENFLGIVMMILIGAILGFAASSHYTEKRVNNEIVKPFAINMTQSTTDFEIPPYGFDLICMAGHSTVSLQAKLTTAKNMLIPVAIPLEDTCDTSAVNERMISVRYVANGLPVVEAQSGATALKSVAHLLNKEKFVATFKEGFNASALKAQLQYEGKVVKKPRTTPAASKQPLVKVPTAIQTKATSVVEGYDSVRQNVSAN